MDILNKFEKFELNQRNRISKEDKEGCERIQAIYEQTLSAYKKWYDAYHAAKASIEEYNLRNLKLKDLSICECIEKLHNGLISSIYSYFTNKYKVKIINNFEDKNDYDYNHLNNTINTSPLDYKLYVEDIIKQLNGLDFESLRIKQLKEDIKGICQNRYNKEWNIDIKGNTIRFKGLVQLSFWGMDFDKFLKIESALSRFEFGNETKFSELNMIRKSWSLKWHEITPNIELNTTKNVKSLKFFQNGRVDVKFSSPEMAREFIQNWCGYTLSSVA